MVVKLRTLILLGYKPLKKLLNGHNREAKIDNLLA